MRIDWVDKHIGISKSIDDYNELVKQDVDFIANTRFECHDDIIELTSLGIGYFWFPIVDFFPPTTYHITSLLNLIKRYPDKKILVHCTLGMGRSACLVAMYMIHTYGLTVNEAVKKLTKIRPEVKLTDIQLEKLHEYWAKDIRRRI